MSDKIKILFVTPILGHPPKGGPELRIENSIKALSKVATVSLYSRSSHARIGGAVAVDYLCSFVDAIYFAPFCRKRNSIRSLVIRAINLFFRKLFGRNVLPVGSEGEADFQDVINTAEAVNANVIWLGYGNISYPLLKYIKAHSKIPVVVDTDSVWSRFVLRGAEYAKNEAERNKVEAEGRSKEEEERWGTCLADATTAVSEIDAEYYRSLTDEPARVHVFSNVLDISTYKAFPPPAEFETPCIYLAGTFWQDSPMEDAARWMLDEVLPILKQELPEIHFYIAGRGSSKFLCDVKDRSVTIAGELPSVLPYLTNATVAVVPLRFESGTRYKILEAGACNVPVVSTTLGAEGIPVAHDKDILIADTPEAFAREIIKVVHDQSLAEKLGKNLGELINKGYSIDALALEGQNILRYLLKEVER